MSTSYIYVYNNSSQSIKYWTYSNGSSYPTIQAPTTVLAAGSHISASASSSSSSSKYAAVSFGLNGTTPKLISYTMDRTTRWGSDTYVSRSKVTTWSDPANDINKYIAQSESCTSSVYTTTTYRVVGVVDVTDCFVNISLQNASLEMIEGTTSSVSSPYKLYFSANKKIKFKLHPTSTNYTVGPVDYWETEVGGGWEGGSWTNPQIVRADNSNEVTITLTMPTKEVSSGSTSVTVPEWSGLYYDNITIPVGVGDTCYDLFSNKRPPAADKVVLKGTNTFGSSGNSADITLPNLTTGNGYTLTIPYYGMYIPYAPEGSNIEMQINGGSWQTVPTNWSTGTDTTINNVKTIKLRATNFGSYSYDWTASLSYSQDITHYATVTKTHKANMYLCGQAQGGDLIESDTVYLVANAKLERDGSWPCFIAGTKITLADGSKKNVEDITYNDELLVWNFYEGKFDKAKPMWIKIEQEANVYNKLVFDNGATLGLVGPGAPRGYHRIYNIEAGKFTHTGVDETPVGTMTFTDSGKQAKLISQELIHEDVKFYNIMTDKHYNLFANGILTSCTLSNQYEIKNMKYDLTKANFDEEFVKDYIQKIQPFKVKETN